MKNAKLNQHKSFFNYLFLLTDLEKILIAREERDSIKRRLSESGNVLISMNLNIPGLPKSNKLIAEFFLEIKDQLKNWLLANRIFINEAKEIILNHAAGDYYIVPLKKIGTNPIKIKQITEQFEENHALGRFIDVDITGESGEIISSGKSKICFYCKKHPAIECRRAQTHKIEEIRQFQEKKIKAYLKRIRFDKISRELSSYALQAIIHEISLSPKPGLVNRIDSGVHKDMNFSSFVGSTSIISTFFKQLIKSGFNCKTKNLSNALPLIRQIGLQMEKEMFEQTNGVNTQKGLIFLMGVSLFASGYIFKNANSFNSIFFRETVQIICKNLIDSELLNNNSDVKSHGEKCFDKFQVSGTRGEAENGFPTVFKHALPILEIHNSINDNTLILTLLTIMSKLDDTNVLYRSDMKTLDLLKDKCDNLLKKYSFDNYKEIIDFCTAKKISPGGSADLLSITIFIYLLIKNFP